MIRPAREADIPAIVDLCVEALSIDRYTELVISREQIEAGVREVVGSIEHFGWVSEEGGAVQGALGAQVNRFAMYERKQAQVTIWYCKKVGDGVKLLRQFLAWAAQRPLIKQVLYIGERGADPRVSQMFMREAAKFGRAEFLPLCVVTR